MWSMMGLENATKIGKFILVVAALLSTIGGGILTLAIIYVTTTSQLEQIPEISSQVTFVQLEQIPEISSQVTSVQTEVNARIDTVNKRLARMDTTLLRLLWSDSLKSEDLARLKGER